MLGQALRAQHSFFNQKPETIHSTTLSLSSQIAGHNMDNLKNVIHLLYRVIQGRDQGNFTNEWTQILWKLKQNG